MPGKLARPGFKHPEYFVESKRGGRWCCDKCPKPVNPRNARYMTAAEVELHEMSWDHLAHIPSTSGGGDCAEKGTKDEDNKELGHEGGWEQRNRGWGQGEKDWGQDHKGWGETNDEKVDDGWGGGNGWGVDNTKEQGDGGWDQTGPSLADWAVVDNMESLMQKFIIVWRETVADGVEHPDEELVLPSMADFFDNPPKTPPREVPALEGWDTVESGWNIVTPKTKRGRAWGGFTGNRNRNRPNDKAKTLQKPNGAKAGTGKGNDVSAWHKGDQWDDSKPKENAQTGDGEILGWNQGVWALPAQETDLWASKAEPRDLWEVPKPVHPQPDYESRGAQRWRGRGRGRGRGSNDIRASR